jgi:two-component system sensor histidine kinase KdpD
MQVWRDNVTEQNRELRGKLTVFLGAAAGVGKTYTMLETARQRLSEGMDVAVGWVETHGRTEMEQMLDGLPRIAPQAIHLPGQLLFEMDADAIEQRRPQLVLIDDLAHVNAPGCCHLRRYQDVEDLLQAGIDVYTTLNIQHLESLNDIVARITGVVVVNTVPDRFLEQAESVQLVDISADELIKRFDGSDAGLSAVESPELRKFYRPGNINALRELALRFTAKRVDSDLHEYMREHEIAGPWPAAERILVCVSASPFAAQIIRAAVRMASGMQAELIALHVEAEKRRKPIRYAERDQAARNLRLAEELGARTITVVGDDLGQEILEAATRYNVSSIVIGKPQMRRWRDYLKGSLIDQLTRNSGGIQITMIQGQAEAMSNSGIKTQVAPAAVDGRQYLAGFMMTVTITAFCVPFREQIDLINIALIYQLPVVMSAFWWGRWPSYFVALVAVASFNFLFIPPLYTFHVDDIRYVWSFITFLIVAFVIGGRTEWLRAEAAAARQRERSTRALYEFSKEIAAVVDLSQVLPALIRKAADAIGRPVRVLLPEQNGESSVAVLSPWGEEILIADGADPELEAAGWAFEHAQPTGRSTDTLSGVQYLYLPMIAGQDTIGVLGVHLGERQLSPEEKRLIDAWVNLASLAIERVSLAAKAREASLLSEADRLRNALFNSISHELRTPLASIVGSVSSLLDKEGAYSDKAKQELLENVQEGAMRMERVVANLLDSARLESGMMQLKIDWCDMQDILGTALQRLRDRIKHFSLKIDVSEELPLIRGDCVLLELVVLNLLDNALKYSPRGTNIDIVAEMAAGCVQVSIADQGAGIPEADLNKVFDKFYRVRQPKQVSGTGLGLSICKGIIESHGGSIRAELRPAGGTVIRFRLPPSSRAKTVDEGNGE